MHAPALPALAPLSLLGVLVVVGCGRDGAAPPDVPVYRGDVEVVDDGAADPAFAAFRDALRAVVARRDTAALLALVSPTARVSFEPGPPGGPDGFRRLWFSGATPTGTPVWDVLGTALGAGSVEEDGAFTVPFVPGLWPSDLDPFAHVAVVGRDVPVYDAPGGAVVALASEIALPVTAPARDGWWPVRLPGGEGGVVAADRALSPVGYRATFWDDGDGLRLQSFLGGD